MLPLKGFGGFIDDNPFFNQTTECEQYTRSRFKGGSPVSCGARQLQVCVVTRWGLGRNYGVSISFGMITLEALSHKLR